MQSTYFYAQPHVLSLRDHVTAAMREQNLRIGPWTDEERRRLIKEDLANMNPMVPIGLRNIKKVELATKWRKFVPTEYQDDICPIPTNEVIESVRKDLSKKNKKNRPAPDITDTATSNNIDTDTLIEDETIIRGLKVVHLKKQLGMRKLSKQGKKLELIERLIENIHTNVSNVNVATNEETATTAVSENVGTSPSTNNERNDS